MSQRQKYDIIKMIFVKNDFERNEKNESKLG